MEITEVQYAWPSQLVQLPILTWLCLPGLPSMHGRDKNWVIDRSDRRLPFLHLSLIIMEVENGGLEDDLVSRGPFSASMIMGGRVKSTTCVGPFTAILSR